MASKGFRPRSNRRERAALPRSSIPLGISGAIQENYRVKDDLQKDQAQKEAVNRGCIHRHALLHLGACLGCRRTPLSPNFSDHHNQNRSQSREDAA